MLRLTMCINSGELKGRVLGITMGGDDPVEYVMKETVFLCLLAPLRVGVCFWCGTCREESSSAPRGNDLLSSAGLNRVVFLDGAEGTCNRNNDFSSSCSPRVCVHQMFTSHFMFPSIPEL